MTAARRIIIGGVGALMPVILNLLVIDFQKLASDATWLKALGFVVKVVVLFGLGGFMAWLNSTARKPLTIFQLGLGAPAIILGMLNGADARQQTTSIPSIESVVFAQGTPQQVPKKFEPPRQTSLGEFVEGLTGLRPRQAWFVIVGSHSTVQAARKQADSINASGKGFAADVYEPYGNNKFYGVVIGANLSYSDANALQQRATRDGLARDAYLWTFSINTLRPPSLPRAILLCPFGKGA